MLSSSTVLTLLCSFQFQSELGQKQTGFSGPCFTAQCGHTWSIRGLIDLNHFMSSANIASFFSSPFLDTFFFFFFNSMDLYMDTWGTLLLLKCSIYPYDFFLLGTESLVMLCPVTTLAYFSSFFYYTEAMLKGFFDSSNTLY